MRKVKVIVIGLLLSGIYLYYGNDCLAEKKPWERTIVGKVTEIDKKYDILTVEVKKTEGFFKKIKTVKIPIRVLTLPNKRTEILIGSMNGAVRDINIGDTVNIDYEMTASAGNVAERIEVARPDLRKGRE